MQQDVGDLIVLCAVAVIFRQYPEIVNDSKVFVDDVLFSRSGVFGGNNMQLLRALRNFEDKFKQPDCRFTGSGG